MGYKRPLSRGELRRMRRERRRIITWSALVVFLALAGVAGLIYLIYRFQFPSHW
jgi:hypothetical protein